MKTAWTGPGPIPAGGFYLENGLPDAYYALTGGELSLTVERGGGINTICLLDVLEHDGTLYPDASPTPPLFLREGNLCGHRPLYGPALQFISTNVQPDGKPGRNLVHFPERMELYPFGFRSESERFEHRLAYDLCIEGRAVLFRFSNAFPSRDRLVVSINKDHIISGEMRSAKWVLLDLSVPEELRNRTPHREAPYHDPRRMTNAWNAVGLDEANDAFRMDGHMDFVYGRKDIAAVLAGSRPLAMDERKSRYLLSIPWDRERETDEIVLCLAAADTREDALRCAHDRIGTAGEIMAGRIRDTVAYAESTPRLAVDGLPAAAEFARTVGAFVRAMVFAETEHEACIRAAFHKYGFIAGWDQTCPTKALLELGDHQRAKKLLRYMLNFPQVELGVWFSVQLIVAVDDAVACSGDRAFLRDSYPALKRIFRIAADWADPGTGLVRLHNTCGVDDPGEIGIRGPVWPACINGWWYGACRSMENFAMILEDPGVENEAHAIGNRIAAAYTDVFYDEDRGYLHAAVDPSTGRGAGVYQNVSTQGMDYPYGETLLRSRLPELAEYQAFALCHPAGRSAVAYDDNADEMWKNVIMFQHIGHETKTARAANLGEEALRIVGAYLRIFDRTKVGIETHNLSSDINDISQRADWQAFCPTAAYDALLCGILGIQWDMGGLAYVPCDLSGTMTLDRFRFRDASWDVRVEGTGGYTEPLGIDGTPILGTLRVPAEYLDGSGAHSLEVVRSAEPWTRPTLLNAPGAAITDLESDLSALSFTVGERVHTSVKAFCPARPQTTLDGQPIDVEWDETTGIMWCDAVIPPSRRLAIRC